MNLREGQTKHSPEINMTVNNFNADSAPRVTFTTVNADHASKPMTSRAAREVASMKARGWSKNETRVMMREMHFSAAEVNAAVRNF